MPCLEQKHTRFLALFFGSFNLFVFDFIILVLILLNTLISQAVDEEFGGLFVYQLIAIHSLYSEAWF